MTPRRRIGCGAAAVALVLGGCQVAREPPTPPPPAPTRWREGAATDGWPRDDWWRGFGSPELNALVAEAERDGDDVLAAEARVRQADAQARIAGAPLLPSLSFGPSVAAVRRNTTLGKERHYGDGSGVFQASYEIDLWGRYRAARDAARASADAAREDRAIVAVVTAAGVAQSYVQLLELRDEMAAVRENLAVGRQVFADTQAMRRGGLGTELPVVQQQVVVTNLANQAPPLQAQAAHALDALAVLVGRSPEALQVASTGLGGLTPPSLEAGLPSRLLAHRPDVQAAERRLAAADANITVARAQFLPDFSMTGSGGIEALALVQRVAGPDLIYNLALNAVQPIFDGGRLKGQLDLSLAQKAELVADYAKTIHQAYADVEDALAAAGAATQQEEDAGRVLAQAQHALDLSRTAYRAGVSDILTVLSAESAVFPDRMALAQARAARLQSLIALYQALGGGWSLRS